MSPIVYQDMPTMQTHGLQLLGLPTSRLKELRLVFSDYDNGKGELTPRALKELLASLHYTSTDAGTTYEVWITRCCYSFEGKFLKWASMPCSLALMVVNNCSNGNSTLKILTMVFVLTGIKVVCVWANPPAM